MMKAKAARTSAGGTLLISDVPLLGPPLSVMEMLMISIPGMQKYEDDLRDRWHSRVNRDGCCASSATWSSTTGKI